MRQRRSGTEHVYRSNARFWNQSQSFLPVESIETFNTKTLMASTQDRTFNILVSEFYLWRISLLIMSQHEIQRFLLSFECFHSKCNSNICLVPLSQAPTTKYWTFDGFNRQLHMGRSADQRRWHRTPDSGRMDPAHYEVRQKYSYCDLVFSYRPVNNTHRGKPRNRVHSVVSFRLDCFTVLWTG